MKKLALLLPALLFVSPVSHAERRDKLAEFVNESVSRVSSALNEGQDESYSPDAGLEGWDMKNFYLYLKATVGFELPFMANLTLVPSVELVFHKLDESQSQR